MPDSRLLGERFKWRRVLLFHFRYSSCLAAFNEVHFSDSIEGQKEGSACYQYVSLGSTVLPRTESSSQSEYSHGGHLSSSMHWDSRPCRILKVCAFPVVHCTYLQVQRLLRWCRQHTHSISPSVQHTRRLLSCTNTLHTSSTSTFVSSLNYVCVQSSLDSWRLLAWSVIIASRPARGEVRVIWYWADPSSAVLCLSWSFARMPSNRY